MLDWITLSLVVLTIVFTAVSHFGIVVRQRAIEITMKNWAEEVDRNVNVYIQAYVKDLMESLTVPELGKIEKIIDSSYGEEI